MQGEAKPGEPDAPNPPNTAAANAAPPAAELLEGTTLLDRYVLESQVASGGMATIHRARDTRLERIVCVKLLRVLLRGGSASNADVVYRLSYRQFLQEALSLSKLQHPNTLRIYDFGYLDDARPFQISEYLDGGNLEEYLRAEGPLGESEALSIIDPITGALEEAHDHGIIHRDIKPSNILFSLAGGMKFPKLADFGIALRELAEPLSDAAARVSAPPAEPLSTVTLFSPRWAAPEQLTNRGEGPYTDVYALALTVASLLGGRPFFNDAAIRQTFGRRAAGDAFVDDRLRALAVRRPMRDALMAALTVDVVKRTATPAAFFEDLRAAVARGSGPESIRPSALTPPLAPPPPPPRRTLESITIARSDAPHRASAPPEPVEEIRIDVGANLVRIIPVSESLDIVAKGDDRDVRLRATLIPGTSRSHRIHLKNLTGFIRKVGGQASAALNAEVDGEAEFLSDNRTPYARCRWTFATLDGDASVFLRADGAIALAPMALTPVVAIEVHGHHEIIVLAPVAQTLRE